jgi:hypothetical protein
MATTTPDELPPLPATGFEIRILVDFLGYAVAADGTVYCCRRRGFGDSAYTAWRILKPYFNKRANYFYISLRIDGKATRFRLHKLILTTFRGAVPAGMECCHNDGNTRNNALSNLSFGTHTKNIRDKISHGTYQYGFKNPSAKLTTTQVEKIREERAEGASLKELGSKYGITPASASRIIRRIRRDVA